MGDDPFDDDVDVAGHRRMTLVDLVVLVAAFAIGFWVCRYGLFPVVNALIGGFESKNWAANPIRLAWNWGSLILRHLQTMVSVLTFAVLGLSLRHPRPNLSRMARQPGFTACLSVSLVLFVDGILNTLTMRSIPAPGYRLQKFVEYAIMPHGSEPGLAIAACWLVLILQRSWRSGRNWVERSGLILAGFWLLMIFVNRLGTGAFF